jgi:hypothetical protein
VDGEDQSVKAGNFLWLQHAEARVEVFETLPEGARLVATHNGYERLSDPVKHRRQWVYDAVRKRLVVTDAVECKAPHRLEWFWHFAPGCGVSVGANTLVARREGVILTMTWPAALTGRLVTASEHPPLGWYSSTLDRKQPAITAVVEMQAQDTQALAGTALDFEIQLKINSP